jgi:hypothetical protein
MVVSSDKVKASKKDAVSKEEVAAPVALKIKKVLKSDEEKAAKSKKSAVLNKATSVALIFLM